jgi:hypothetical protein
MFKALYDSPLVGTALPCVFSLAVIVWAWRKRPLPRAYATVFAIAIAADAYLNGPWTFVKSNTAWATAVGVFFVIFGDFRYFVVLEECMHNARKLTRFAIPGGVPRAVVWAFVVPVTAQIIRWRFPRIESDERSTFLVYELLFFVLAAATLALRVPRAKALAAARRATQFEIVMYATWILADVGIITIGSDVFYLVRLVANLMYYVALVPFMTKRFEEAFPLSGGEAS